MTTRADIESRVMVMQAWLDGKKIQFRPSGESGPMGWRDFDCSRAPRFDFAKSEYRVRPIEPDFIDWTHVAPRFKFMARDEDGSTYLYEKEPVLTGFSFYAKDSLSGTAEDYASFRKGLVDWSNSLVCRPEGA